MAHDALAAMGIPVTMTAHGADIETDCGSGHGFRLRPEHDERIKALARRASSLTAISPQMEVRYREMGAPADRIRYIPNGVDIKRFRGRNTDRNAVRRAFGLPVDKPLVLTVGSNRPAKGHRFIPPALAALRREERDIAWVILGGEQGEMCELARQERVADDLHILPALLGDAGCSMAFPSDQVIDLYKAADVFALPSLSEGFGLVAIEAMAAGLPVVASAVGGLEQTISDGENGLLCPAAAPERMAAVIGRVLDESDLRQRLTAGAQKTVELYDWDKIAVDYLDLYRDLAERAA